MKGTVIILLILLLLAGCATFFEVADIFIGETVLHEGIVSSVEYGQNLEILTVFFEEGSAYTCTICNTMIRKGDKVKVVLTYDGQIKFEREDEQ